MPGGRFVLAAGDLDALPALHRAARRHANERGLAVERAGSEIYRPGVGEKARPSVDAAVRVHD